MSFLEELKRITAQGLANTGQELGLPERNWSEWLSGSNTQTRPASGAAPGLFGSGGYVASPIPGGASNWTVSGGVAQDGPQKGQVVATNPQPQNSWRQGDPIPTGYTERNGSLYNLDANAGGNNSNLQDLARKALESKINSINQRLAALRDEAARQRGVAGGVRDELVKNVDDRYGGLQTERGLATTKALGTLAEEDRGVVRDYARTQGGLNRSTEGAIGKNRALARALGIGNSSYYMNTQDNTRNSLLDKTSALGAEESAKLGGIKQRVSDTNIWDVQKKLDLDNEAATLKSSADRSYQDQVGQIQFNERVYGIDQSGEAEAAQFEYETKLAGIAQYIADKGSQVAGINSAATTAGAKIAGFSGIDENLAGKLATNTAMNGATAPMSSSLIDGGAYASPSNIGNRARISKYLRPEDQYLYA